MFSLSLVGLLSHELQCLVGMGRDNIHAGRAILARSNGILLRLAWFPNWSTCLGKSQLLRGMVIDDNLYQSQERAYKKTGEK